VIATSKSGLIARKITDRCIFWGEGWVWWA